MEIFKDWLQSPDQEALAVLAALSDLLLAHGVAQHLEAR